MVATNTPSLPTVLAVIAGWYAVVPLFVWSKLPRAKAWQTEPFDQERHEMSPGITEFLRTNLAPLREAGFRQVGDLVHRGAKTTARVAVLEDSDGVVATVVALTAAPRLGRMVPTTVMMVEFTAVLPTGTVLDVNNSPSLPVFPIRSDHVVYRFPQIRDP